jgi:hypothetical protein
LGIICVIRFLCRIYPPSFHISISHIVIFRGTFHRASLPFAISLPAHQICSLASRNVAVVGSAGLGIESGMPWLGSSFAS